MTYKKPSARAIGTLPPVMTDGTIRLRPPRATDATTITTAYQDPTIARNSLVIPYPYRYADAVQFLGTCLSAWAAAIGAEFVLHSPGVNNQL